MKKERIACIDNLWETPIWRAKIEEVNNEDIARFILDECDDPSSKALEKSNYGGWHSRENLHTDIKMKGLCEEIRNVCFEFWPFIKGIKFQQMWAIVNKKNDWNMFHQHGTCNIAGAYYLRVSEDSGRIVFHDPKGAKNNHFIDHFIIGEELRFYQPKGQELMMWPSYLNHFVEPNKSDEDRIVISFNLDIDTFGETDGIKNRNNR